jgi:hypothetical protein
MASLPEQFRSEMTLPSQKKAVGDKLAITESGVISS